MRQLSRPLGSLERTGALAESILRDLPGAAVLVFDSDTRYVLVTGGALGALGWNADEMVGRLARDVFPADGWRRLAGPYAAALRGESAEWEHTTQDGSGVYASQAMPVRDPESELVGGMCLLRELSRPSAPAAPPLLDESALEPLEAESRELMRRLVPLFAQELDTALSQLDAATRAADGGEVARIAHRLKGGSRTLGAVAVAALCERLEVEAQAGDFARVAELTGELARVGQSSVDALRACAR